MYTGKGMLVARIVKAGFILIAMLFLAPHSFASQADGPEQKAIEIFLKTQNDKADSRLNAQISSLMKAGFKERGSTGAVLLSEGCGVVGCINTYLVTTAYSTPGANRRSTVVAAIVTNPSGRQFRVRRILSSVEIKRLVNQK